MSQKRYTDKWHAKMNVPLCGAQFENQLQQNRQHAQKYCSSSVNNFEAPADRTGSRKQEVGGEGLNSSVTDVCQCFYRDSAAYR